MIYKNLTSCLEKLRINRKFRSQEVFVADIIEVRQYRKYIRGEQKMPEEIFRLLTERLNVGIEVVLNEYFKQNNNEHQLVQGLYNALMSNNYSYYTSFIKSNKIETQDARVLFSFCTHLFNLKTNKCSQEKYIMALKELLDYPKILDKTSLSLYELLMLCNLINYLPKFDYEQVIKMTTSFLDGQTKILDYSDLDAIIISLREVARFFGSSQLYERALEFSNHAIKLLHSYHHYYLLADFYYINSLCYHKQDNIKERDQMIYLCISILEHELNHTYRDYLYRLIMKDFDIHDIQIFFRNYK